MPAAIHDLHMNNVLCYENEMDPNEEFFSGLIFSDGARGTGKTFLLNILVIFLCAKTTDFCDNATRHCCSTIETSSHCSLSTHPSYTVKL